MIVCNEFSADPAGMTNAQASQLIRNDVGLGKIFTHERRTPADVKSLTARARHSAHAAALPEQPDAATVGVLHHEPQLRRQNRATPTQP